VKEVGIAVAYDEIVVGKEELTWRSQVATDSKAVAVPNNDKHCSVTVKYFNARKGAYIHTYFCY
jgi:hypothetical protein